MVASNLDLQQRRIQRAKARAAKQEGRSEKFVIRDGDTLIAELPAEFPLDTLEPLVDVNLDIALLIEQAIQIAGADSQAQQIASIELITQILASNPNLFRELIDAVKEMTRRLLGADGYDALVATRPTAWDIIDLAREISAWYGISLGESSPPSIPSSGGGTSNSTSSTISSSMPVVSGNAPATLNSSESGGSLTSSSDSPTTP
jgi:hypothetical protein